MGKCLDPHSPSPKPRSLDQPCSQGLYALQVDWISARTFDPVQERNARRQQDQQPPLKESKEKRGQIDHCATLRCATVSETSRGCLHCTKGTLEHSANFIYVPALGSRSLSHFSFSAGHISAAPFHPGFQEEMTLQLEKEEDSV